jgi:hypothetical protein
VGKGNRYDAGPGNDVGRGNTYKSKLKSTSKVTLVGKRYEVDSVDSTRKGLKSSARKSSSSRRYDSGPGNDVGRGNKNDAGPGNDVGRGNKARSYDSGPRNDVGKSNTATTFDSGPGNDVGAGNNVNSGGRKGTRKVKSMQSTSNAQRSAGRQSSSRSSNSKSLTSSKASVRGTSISSAISSVSTSQNARSIQTTGAASCKLGKFCGSDGVVYSNECDVKL